jgi:hypothetical protein
MNSHRVSHVIQLT